MVDWVPIRVFRNHAGKGVAFPRWQPMWIKASLWNGDSWATRGGRDKANWSKGPFVAWLRNYKADACVWKGRPRFCWAENSGNWWNQRKFESLTWKQRRLFKWARKYYLIYDYCQDTNRFQQDELPRECSLPKYWTRSIWVTTTHESLYWPDLYEKDGSIYTKIHYFSNWFTWPCRITRVTGGGQNTRRSTISPPLCCQRAQQMVVCRGGNLICDTRKWCVLAGTCASRVL